MTRDELMNLLCNDFGLDRADLADDTPLFSSGRLDSFRLVDLMMEIETRSGFRMDPGEVDLDNLDSIEAILRYVARRKAS